MSAIFSSLIICPFLLPWHLKLFCLVKYGQCESMTSDLEILPDNLQQNQYSVPGLALCRLVTKEENVNEFSLLRLMEM